MVLVVENDTYGLLDERRRCRRPAPAPTHPAERAAFERVYQQLPTTLSGADTVQLSGPPLDEPSRRWPWVPEVLPVLPMATLHGERLPSWRC